MGEREFQDWSDRVERHRKHGGEFTSRVQMLQFVASGPEWRLDADAARRLLKKPYYIAKAAAEREAAA